MKSNILKIIILGTMICSKTLSAQDPNFHIYLCFGQSNMEGQGTIEAKDKTVDARFRVLQSLDCSNISRTKNTWYTATPPLCQCWTGLSPADYFGQEMIFRLPDHIKIGIINVAVGGSDIRLFDKDLYQSYTAGAAWFENKISDYGGNPYNHLLNLAKLAQKDGVIKGILLHQGETNTGDASWPSYVKKIFDDLKTDLSLAEDIPLLAGELVSVDGSCCASMNTVINKLPETIPTAHVISSEGCTAKDKSHFDSEGYRTLGTRYAQKMLELVAYDPEAPTSIPTGLNYEYKLYQNTPNPTDNTTKFRFYIPRAGKVSLVLHDIHGTEIDQIISQNFTSGEHSLEYELSSLCRGVYFYSMNYGEERTTLRLIVR